MRKIIHQSAQTTTKTKQKLGFFLKDILLEPLGNSFEYKTKGKINYTKPCQFHLYNSIMK